jgi:lipoprotein-anchoring transpeptidase ErfK/SrfK
MFAGRLIFAAVLGLATATVGAAQAQTTQGAFAKAFAKPQAGAAPLPATTVTTARSTSRPTVAATPANFQPQGRTLYPEDVPRSRVAPAQFRRQMVRYQTDEKPGTIIIDTHAHFLYFVLGNGRAMRYGVGVGRTGFGWSGTVRVADKREWPAWRPPPEMIAREARRGHSLPTFVAGGEGNPLGARALYLHNANGDTGYRIHGTSEPWTIGLDVSSGCIRLVNDDVIDLYKRAGVGTKVIVL